MKLAMALSTAYRSRMRAIRDGIACKPVWTVAVPREEDDFHPVSRQMFLWLNANVDNTTYDIHKQSAMSWGIEAVTFDHHEDALLFFVTFQS